MAELAVSASTGVMNSLISKLSILLSDQYKQVRGVRRDIEFLKRELMAMKAALEKLTDMEKLDGEKKVWRDNFREMAYDIEDCIDIFMCHHEDDDKGGLFHKTARKIRKLRVRYQIANEIQNLKARVVEQSQIRDRYKIEESTSKSIAVEVDPRLPALFEESKRLVGIDVPQEEITKLLMEQGDSDFGQLKVVSIVGFGGLGKTTLAKQVHRKINYMFEWKAFVSVSRSPDMTKILKGILSGDDGNRCMEETDDKEKLILAVRALLANKRYLIVIDDLWSIKAWKTIECALVQNNKGSRVITTTRIHEVAKACCIDYQGQVYHMKSLSDLHSRWLFFKRIFDTEDSSEQFREISADMLRKCKGVPLAIISIASLLANKRRDVDTWEKILKSLGSELDTNPSLEWMSLVLNLSYNDLDPELKTCLLYLGTYPEDSVIQLSDLRNKWIAEGFIRGRRGLELEEAAESRFNELINRSMIEPVFYDLGGEVVSGCRVHDIMLDLIISKCREENFVTIIDGQFSMNEASQARRISHQSGNKDIALAVERMRGSHVRSYNSFPAADCIPPLSKFEHLRILHMMGRASDTDPENMCVDLSAINQLFLLRYLKISGFHLKLPKKFGKLKHLMTLDITLAKLYPCNQSSDFTSLSSLRHLYLPYGDGVVLLKNGLSKLCSLHTLRNFNIGANSVECIRDLGELTNLRELCFYYSSRSHETILAASLEKLGNSNLRRLVWNEGGEPLTAQFWSNCFTRPRHLQSFFVDCSMPKISKWMAHADRLASLRRLEVEELRSDDLQVLASLPCLVYLYLVVTTIPEKHIIIHPNSFPSLKDFTFWCEPSCLTFEKGAMPWLQILRIHYTDCIEGGAVELQEGSPVAGVEHLASLRKVSIYIPKCGQSSKMKSAWGDAINKHPKSDAIQFLSNGMVIHI